MERILVDFSKLPEEVLDEYGIEIFDSYQDVFYSLYLDDDEFSPYSLIDMLGDMSIPEFISNEPYLYEFDGKFYRWTEDELMGELAEKYPDAVVTETIPSPTLYTSPLDQFIEAEVPFRIEELYNLPLTQKIKEDLIEYVQNRSDIMFDYDAFDNRLINKYDELVRGSCQTYESVIEYLCAVLNKEENDEYNRKIEEFSPIFESTHYFGIYSYNGDNEYYLVSKEGEYELVLDDGFDRIGKNNLTLLEGEEILHIANKEFFGNLVEYSRENIKGLIPERELAGLHVLELAFNPNDVNLIFESVKRQLESEANCTGYGEPQAFVTLENGRSIEVTLEKEMLPETDYFYSARLHCTEEEFNNKDYNSTVGIINCVTSASANVDEIKDLLIATLKCNEQYPIENHSKKPSLDSVINIAQERCGTPISSEHFYAIDSKNYVDKETHPTDHHEDYYKFYFNGEFAGGLANKHVLNIARTSKADVELVDQAIIQQFNNMHRERNLFSKKENSEAER